MRLIQKNPKPKKATTEPAAAKVTQSESNAVSRKRASSRATPGIASTSSSSTAHQPPPAKRRRLLDDSFDDPVSGIEAHVSCWFHFILKLL